MPLFIYSVKEESTYTVAVEASDRVEADALVYEQCDDGDTYGEGGYVETTSEYTGMTLLETKGTGEKRND